MHKDASTATHTLNENETIFSPSAQLSSHRQRERLVFEEGFRRSMSPADVSNTNFNDAAAKVELARASDKVKESEPVVKI